MTTLRFRGGRPLRGTIRIPGDKSVSHRALIFNAIANGQATVTGLLDSEDVRATADCLAQLGVSIAGGRVVGRGGTLNPPGQTLNCGNSGTTMRLLLGVLAGQDFDARLTGDGSLQRRPMGRVTEPLTTLGATFGGSGKHAPLDIRGGRLTNAHITSKVASAQVKTAVMLAAIQGEGRLTYTEPVLSRDHTERMLGAMGVQLVRSQDPSGAHTIQLDGPQTPQAIDVDVPGDISSAAFFLVAGSIVAGSEIVVEHVGVNPSRTGVLDVLVDMGADITLSNSRDVGGEPVADIRVKFASLCPARIDRALIPRLVDEVPVLAVAMAHAAGESVITEASELRVKESDRIQTTLGILQSLGAKTTEQPDGFTVSGQPVHELRPPTVDAGLDHRIAMASVVAGLPLSGETVVHGANAINSSFPTFMNLVEHLRD